MSAIMTSRDGDKSAALLTETDLFSRKQLHFKGILMCLFWVSIPVRAPALVLQLAVLAGSRDKVHLPLGQGRLGGP
jgi:hypothetical protein